MNFTEPGRAVPREGRRVSDNNVCRITTSFVKTHHQAGSACNEADTYVLCEINVSSVFAFPEQAPPEIARLARDRSAAYKSGVLSRLQGD